jgi:hypothetical protein
MIERMLNDDINFDEIFRYSPPTYEIYNITTNEVFGGTLEEAKASPVRGSLRKRVKDSEELEAILTVLKMYTNMDDEQLSVVRKVYLGMNLNQPYANTDKLLTRKDYVVGETEDVDICTFSEYELQKAVSPLKISIIQS